MTPRAIRKGGILTGDDHEASLLAHSRRTIGHV
jgi:hypothetical protein